MLPTTDREESSSYSMEEPQATQLYEEQLNTFATEKTHIPAAYEQERTPLDVRWEEIGALNNKEYQILKQDHGDVVDPDTLCGLSQRVVAADCCQGLANKRIFVFLFCVAYVFQGMYYTYFVSVLTTIEKLFQIRSQTTGIIMSATEIGQIGGGLFLSYFGGGGHRPRWMACGILVFALCSFVCALPHFLFGQELLRQLTPTQANPEISTNMCLLSQHVANSTLRSALCDQSTSSSSYVLLIFFVALLGVGLGQTALHNLGIPYIDDNIHAKESPSYFGITIGVRIFGPTLGFVLGSLCTRLYVNPFEDVAFGPTDSRWIGAWWLGLLLISCSLAVVSVLMALFPKRLPNRPECTKPRSPPAHDITHTCPTEPGFEGCSSSPDLAPQLTIVTSSLYNPLQTNYCALPQSPCQYLEDIDEHPPQVTEKLKPSPAKRINRNFPFIGKLATCFKRRNMRRPSKTPFCAQEPPVSERSFIDFFRALKRLVENKMLVLRAASSVLHLLPIAGLYTFLPKYLETQFRLPVHSAAMISGVGGILVMGAGILASGVIIRKVSPSPKSISLWIASTALLYSIGMFMLMFVSGCSHDDIQGISHTTGSLPNFTPICDRNCSGCDDRIYAPICASDQRTYFSACHAGCSSIHFQNGTNIFNFENCECLDENVKADLGVCNTECANLVWYMAIFCVFVIIHSTSEVGGMMLTLRCVDPKDKSMALGLISVAIGLFGNVPCPIIYGAVVDSSCIHWRTSCSGQGACQMYDTNTFRYFFHGTTGVVMLFAFVVDVFVWKNADGVSFEDVPVTEPANAASQSQNSIKLRPDSYRNKDLARNRPLIPHSQIGIKIISCEEEHMIPPNCQESPKNYNESKI